MLTTSLLEWIAALDYGNDTARHAAALRRILDEEQAPAELSWHPVEVLRLGLYGLPNYSGTSRRLTKEEERLCQAFVSAGLLSALGTSRNGGIESTLIVSAGRLLETAPHLTEPPLAETASLLAWLAPRRPEADLQRAFLGVGLIWLVVGSGSVEASRMLGPLADWVLFEEERVADVLPSGSGFLYREFLPRIWSKLGADLATRDMSHLAKPEQAKIRDIGALLA